MKAWPITVCLLIGSLCHAQTPQMDRGVQLFQQGDYEGALAQFEQAHRADPSNGVIENLIGFAETKLNRLQEADQHYKRAIELQPHQAGPHRNLGFNYLNEKQYGMAEAELKRAAELEPSNGFTHYYLMLLYLATSRDKEAIAQAKLAPGLIENDADAAAQLAGAYLRAGQNAAADILIGSMEQANKFTVGQEYSLAVLFTQRRDYAKALELFQRIAQSEPASWGNRYNLAVASLNAGRTADAIKLLEALKSEKPKDADILTLLGSAYETEQDLPHALESYRAAVSADPENTDRYLDYTRLLMDLDRYDEAAQSLESGIKDTADSYPLKIRMGAVKMMQGEYAEARSEFQAAIDLHPEIDTAYVGMAQALSREGREQEALNLLEDTRKKMPQSFMAQFYCGLFASRAGKSEEALAALQTAEQLRPDSEEPHYELGKIYLQEKDLPHAEAELESVIRANPQNAQARYQLSRVYAREGLTAKSRELAAETEKLMKTQREAAIEAQHQRLQSFQTPTAEGMQPIHAR